MLVVIAYDVTDDIEACEPNKLVAAIQMKKGTVDFILVEIAIP